MQKNMKPEARILNSDTLFMERDRLVLWFPVFLGLGIAAYFAESSPSPIGLPALVAGLCALAALFTRRLLWMRVMFMAIAALALGFTVTGLRLYEVQAPVLQEKIFFKTVTGTINELQQKNGKTKLILRDVNIETVDAEHTPKYISISLRKLQSELRIGDRVQLPAALFPPPTPAMPGSYDFSRMYYFKQLGAVGFSPKPAEVIQATQENKSADRLTALRLSIADHLQARMNKDESAVAAAMMVGDQSRISDEVSESMRVAGIYHILSISGMHMTLAIGLMYFSIRFLLSLFPGVALRLPTKKIAASVGLVGGLVYLLLAGYPVAAVRSYIMVACVMVAVLLDRKGISLYSLAWAATLILLISPESLLTAGFQLSFAATLAIVVLYERYGHHIYDSDAGWLRGFRLYLLAVMLTSLAATLYTTPLALYHFNRMAIWGVAANMLMVPLSSFIIMPAAVAVFLLMPMGWDAPALWALEKGIRWMIEGSNWVATLPYADLILPSPNFAGFVAIIVGGLWFAIWRSNLRWLGLAPIAAGLVTIAFYQPYDVIVSDDAKRVAYRTPDNQWVMVRGNTDSFEAESWLRMSGAKAALTRTEAKKQRSDITCDKMSCVITRGDHMIAISLKRDWENTLCASGADIVISDSYVHEDKCPQAKHIIDREFVEIHGAAALRLAPAVAVITSDAQRGTWPWSKQVLVEADDTSMIEAP